MEPDSSEGNEASLSDSDDKTPTCEHSAFSFSNYSSASSSSAGDGKTFKCGPTRGFCDYFVICGLDYNSGLEPLPNYDIEGTSETHLYSPLERSYKPKVLAHYPENVPWNSFDKDAVRNLCLPSGLSLRTQKHSLEPCFHPFVITRENGSQTYGFSFVFYEEVKSKHISSAIQTLQAMHLTELSSATHYHQQRSNQNRNIRNAAANMHKSHKSGSGRAQYLAKDGSNTRSLPRHFKLAAHKQQSITQSFYDPTKDTLYVTKSIALICPLPYIQIARHFLSGLFGSLRYIHNDGEKSLESYVCHLLYNVPLPPPGCSVQCSFFGEKITCQRPSPIELPLLDYFFSNLFRLLDLDSFIQLFTCVLLENQVLLYSKDLYRLMMVAECVTAVLFPFVWQHVYVPILPSTLYHFLDAPVPFIMGLHAPECQEHIPYEDNICFVDIDRNMVHVPEDLPSFPQKSEFIDELSEVLRQFHIPVGNVKSVSKSRSSPHKGRRNRGRKNSWSHESDSGMSSNEESMSLNGSQNNIASSMMQSQYITQPDAYNCIQSTETLQRMISRKQGYSRQNQTRSVDSTDSYSEESFTSNDNYLRNLKLNNGVREIFFNRFVQMFSTYDHFLSQPDGEHGRLVIHNFDKATFLSDQPDQNVPFLSRFLETQMFASLIDRKIASMNGDMDPNLLVFENMIETIRNRYGESLVRTPSYEPCSTIKESELTLEKRFLNPNFVVSPVIEICDSRNVFTGSFPILSHEILNSSPTDARNCLLIREGKKAVEAFNNEVSLPYSSDNPSLRNVLQTHQTNSSPASIAQANWEFVKQLLQDQQSGGGGGGGCNKVVRRSRFIFDNFLKECKTKTKRMLVEKMGPEAAALGHGDTNLVGVEENTLVASLCDLLERIFAHGLHVKHKGKSPLWNFLTNYQESEACKDSTKPIDPQFLTPDLSAMAMELNLNVSSNGKVKDNLRSPDRRSRPRSAELPVLKPLPVSIAFDMKNVQEITEIKTNIGYARAWIRLSLEKKVLSKHLKALLADDELLRGFYKRTSFLRSEEEREQFLCHLLTLNAVEYYCFTNAYTNFVLPYRVLIYPSKRFHVSTTTANVWITVSGSLGETHSMSVPKDSLEFIFKHKNLGFLSTVHIGHDNAGISPKWMLDYILIRNEVTGNCVKFPCGRWLGRDVDDGSSERLLVGEPHLSSREVDPSHYRTRTPPRARSPSIPRRSHELRLTSSEIQQFLGDSVNNIVKYFYKSEKERGSLTVLLCGEKGLVVALEQVFLYGFKSSRIFVKNIYIWDFFIKVKEFFQAILNETDNNIKDCLASEEVAGLSEQILSMNAYCELITKVQFYAESLGKDGKFQLFICLCAREHLLHKLPIILSSCTITAELYEENSFLRDSDLLPYLVQVLEALDGYDIVLEQSLSKGID